MVLATPIAKAAIDLDYVLYLYYISMLIISVITSIAVSRVVYGEVILALKYSALLTILTTLFFSIASALI
jgi:archaellum biogenesis protein FlaJ (TadC family)